MSWREGSSPPTMWRASSAGQDALHSAGVECSEDAGAHSKLPQPSQEEEALMCLLQHCICVSGPCEILSDVNAEELKAVYPLHRCLVDGDGCVFSALSPEIHAGAVPEYRPRKRDNSAHSCKSRFSNRDSDKEAKLMDCSFKNTN